MRGGQGKAASAAEAAVVAVKDDLHRAGSVETVGDPKVPVESEQIHSKILDTVGQVDRVLDVGCGNCDLVRFLAQQVAKDAVGIDINGHKAYERVSAASDDNPRTVRCLQMDAQEMNQWQDGSFDAVVSTHALHEIADPDVALCEIKRVLKKGGRLLIADFTKGETRWNEDYFTPAQVRTMLNKLGFRGVRVEKVSGEHFMFASATK